MTKAIENGAPGGQPTRVILDAHVHLYPGFDAARWFRLLAERLAAAGPSDLYGVLFAERRDCHAFAEFAAGRLLPELPRLPVTTTGGDRALSLQAGNGTPVLLLPGRQLVTAEGIEVLAWLTDASLPEGKPLAETLAAIRGADGIPAFSWAPGKWWGRRGQIIRETWEADLSAAPCLCDTSMRPLGWPEPLLIRRADRMRVPVLAGSDPLPLPGEEDQVGRYLTRLWGPMDPRLPVAGIRRLLEADVGLVERIGRRNNAWEMASRLYRLRRAARAAPAASVPAAG